MTSWAGYDAWRTWHPWQDAIEVALWFRCDHDGIYEDDEDFPDTPCRADWDVFHDTDATHHAKHGETVESVCPECGRKASQYLPSKAEQAERHADY